MRDGYTPAMRESIGRVEATRPARLQESWPMMSPAEKQEVLREFHPDYKPEGMRELDSALANWDRYVIAMGFVLDSEGPA